MMMFRNVMTAVVLLFAFGVVQTQDSSSAVSNTFVRDGSIDSSFNLIAGRSGQGVVRAILAGDDGKQYVAGLFGAVAGRYANSVVRLNRDGSVDGSFDVGAGPDSSIRRLHLQPDGKVLVSGFFTTFNGMARRSVVRLNLDGSVDPTLNLVTNASSLNVAAVYADGRIIVVGDFTLINGVQRRQVARIDALGVVDTSFDFGVGVPGSESVNVVKLLADGKMLIGGFIQSINTVPRRGVARLNANGSLDMGFSLSPDTFVQYIQTIQVYQDSRILISGDRNVARVLSNGEADPTFLSGTNFGLARFAIKQPDGKILVGGNMSIITFGTASYSARGLVRLNEDGSLDESFFRNYETSWDVNAASINDDGTALIGGDIRQTTPTRIYTSLVRIHPNGMPDDTYLGQIVQLGSIFSSLAQPDGKLIIGGVFETINSSSRRFIARVDSRGATDQLFVPNLPFEVVSCVARQADGKYLVGGNAPAFGSGPVLVRLTADGVTDQSFLTADVGPNKFISSIAVQADGKILIGGRFDSINGTPRNGFARLNSDGSIDPLDVEFLSAAGSVDEILVQPDGTILIGGSFSIAGSPQIENLALLNQDGTIDRQFTANHGGRFSQVTALNLINGAIYVGATLTPQGGNHRGPVTKLDRFGMPDTTFNSGRVVGAVRSISPLPFGKLLIGGDFQSSGESGNRNLVMRLIANGGLDYTFDAGRISNANGTIISAVHSVAGISNEKVFVSGFFDKVGTKTAWSAARPNVGGRVTRGASDFDGDGRTDLSIFRPSTRTWTWVKSSSDITKSLAFGVSSDRQVAADYDGDGVTDAAFFRPSTGLWSVTLSSSLAAVDTFLGNSTDIPAPADFDGDGAADVAVFQPSDGTWRIIGSQTGFTVIQHGVSGDVPVPADYDGDGRADLAVFTPSTGEWRIQKSSGGLSVIRFGSSTDKIAPGDFDGDGQADLSFYHPSDGSFSVIFSGSGSTNVIPIGGPSDIPVPGDYDGDGHSDFAVFRPSESRWIINRSTEGPIIRQFGQAGDRPAMNSNTRYVMSGRIFTPSGQGLRNAVVSLIDSQGGVRNVSTSSFGIFEFTEVAAGSYAVRSLSKRYRFAPTLVTVSDDLSNLVIVGLE